MRVRQTSSPFVEGRPSPEQPWDPVRDWPASWIQPPSDWRLPWAALFSCELHLADTVHDRLHVSGDERYELYLDGVLIGRGSERGDRRCWHFESYEVALAPGSHVLAARVWALGPELAPWAQISILPGFLCCPESSFLQSLLATGIADWRVSRMEGISFRSLNAAAGTAMGTGPGEVCHFSKIPMEWRHGRHSTPPVSAIRGPRATNGQDIHSTRPDEHWLVPAQLPPSLRRTWDANRIRALATDSAVGETPVPAAIPARRSARILLDLGDYVCGYPSLDWTGGAGARITVGWAEVLRHAVSGEKIRDPQKVPAREIRFSGPADELFPEGQPAARRSWSPHWWRCGRFVEITVETADEPLILDAFSIEETRFPLEPRRRWHFSEAGTAAEKAQLDALFRVCVRTAQVCAHETYMDCPFYEQLMYAGDTRVQCLLTYVLGGDPALPRKAIALFDFSRMNPSGLTAAVHPNSGGQLIPTFSLWWVSMVYDYACWTDDLAFVRQRLPGVRAVLDLFARRVDEQGLLHMPAGWNFVDWAFPGGIPPAGDDANGGNNDAGACWQAQWILALRHAEALEAYAGEPELALRWRRHRGAASAALVRVYWDESRGLFADDRQHLHFSEHAQCLSILGGAVPPHQQTRLRKAWGRWTFPGITKVSAYFAHYLFEAGFILGCQDVFFERLEPWHDWVASGAKTTPEFFGDPRSECHAWSAHPVYHYMTGVMGIAPVRPLS